MESLRRRWPSIDGRSRRRDGGRVVLPLLSRKKQGGWACSSTAGFWSLLLLIWMCMLGATAGVASAHQPKNVNVAVQAKWTGTPFLLEAGELLAKENEEAFWLFVEKWIGAGQGVDFKTDMECVQHILKEGTSVVGDRLGSLFHLSLILRSASPKLVLYRQLAQESLHGHVKVPGGELHEVVVKENVESDRWAVSLNPTAPGGRCCWVDVGSHLMFDELEVSNWLKSLEQMSPEFGSASELFEFDHIYPGAEGLGFVVILYGALDTPCFRNFHALLADAAKRGLVKYAFRPVVSSGCESVAGFCGRTGAGGVVNLSGYGVELALKNMEYTAIDDSDSKKGDEAGEDVISDEQQVEMSGEVASLKDHLLSQELSELVNVLDLKDLGFQAAQLVLGAANPLRLMQDINQNLPKLASWLSHVEVNESIRDEILANQKMISPGKNLVAINGALINTDTVDLFSLIDVVQGEISLADKLRKMKVPPSYVSRFLQISEPLEQSTTRVDFRSDEFVHYLNNLEEDAMYRRWPNNLNQLLMPAFPGQFRYVRKNLYHAVYVIDPASINGLSVVDSIMHHHRALVPMRFGLILVSPKGIRHIEERNGDKVSVQAEHDSSSLVIQLFVYLKKELGVSTAFEFLQALSRAGQDHTGAMESIPIEGVKRVFEDILKAHNRSGQNIWEYLQSIDDFREAAVKNSLHAHKLGVSHMQPCLLMNGLFYDKDEVQHGAIAAMSEELLRVQEGVYFGTINQRTDVLNKFLTESGHARYNPQIVGPASEDKRYVSLAKPIATKQIVLSRLQYLHSPGTEDQMKPITHWLILDLSKSGGWDLLREAVQYVASGTTKGRIAVLHNMDLDIAANQLTPANIVFAAMSSVTRRAKIVPFLQRFLASRLSEFFGTVSLNEEMAQSLVKDALHIARETGLKAEYLESFLLNSSNLKSTAEQMLEERALVSTLFRLQAGSDAVVTNGKVFVQEKGKYFLEGDLTLVDAVQYERRVKHIEQVVSEIEWVGMEPDEVTSDFLSTIIMTVSSSMASRSRSSDSARFELLQGDYSAIVKEERDADIYVDAVIDPLSSVGQKLTPLLLLLQEWFQPGMRIVLIPTGGLVDFPLKNFYRYVLPMKYDFSSTDGLVPAGPAGQFLNMPPSRTLTMNLDVPEPWLVEPVVAVYDLDNIVLEKINERSMSAVFELEALIVTGHCFEKGPEPPRGLQLLLGTRFVPHMVDTIVMANLGYWQLKAAPGVWSLKLAPGKSTELYALQEAGEGTDEGAVARRVFIESFRGEDVRLEVVKRKGKEKQKILDADDGVGVDSDHDGPENSKGKSEESSLWKWASGLLSFGKQPDVQPESKIVLLGGHQIERHGETINIFSIASGHLYERFLKIMMLSVLKNTRRPVKFWFIKNYLSPQFKDVIPKMAEEYGFEYDLVTYKWPSWLHKQTEKQRIIWAYKILFLDVIFPLSLKKVIFVDADQIVRADMGELYDMDLGGRALAYTPFCDNNKEMDGYRFWNQGFWKEHLRGRPYHISALYVVDLLRFRLSAAGDKLRVFYETLSKDPNSLSNLDQDLPNYAQHSVPIFSLPQQWLWCESWCGNVTKPQAKTIDLCNNPMTKEPKLESARRIVAEWPALDEEARQFTMKKLVGSDILLPASPKPPSPHKDPDTVSEL